MTKPSNINAIEKATNKKWDEWLKFFDSINAKDLSHHEIAQKVYKHMEEYAEGTHSEAVSVQDRGAQMNRTHGTESAHRKGLNGKWPESGGSVSGSATEQATAVMPSGWWSQNVTVAYEQHIGRRAPGQRSDGKYEVSVTKTFDGTLDEAMKWWLKKVTDLQEFSRISFADIPKQNKTHKWRHWRVNLSDGSKVIVSSNQKAPGKAQLAVTNQKLASAQDAERWRAYWKQFLSNS